MKVDQLRTFLAVLKHGTFSRAAEQMHVSQSTVSFQIAALESATGSRLLDRGRGWVRTTEKGVVLERYAKRILALSDEATRQLQSIETNPSGSLVLAASTIVAEYLMPSMVGAFRTEFPNISITIEVSDSSRSLDSLRSRHCDLAFVGSPANDRRFVSTRFANDDVVLVGPTGGRKKLRHLSMLAELPLVLREPGSGTRESIAKLLVDAQLERTDIVQVGSSEAARRCVLAGLGYSFLSRHAVDDDIRNGRLAIVQLAGTPVRRWFHAVRLRTVTPSAAARAFYEIATDSPIGDF